MDVAPNEDVPMLTGKKDGMHGANVVPSSGGDRARRARMRSSDSSHGPLDYSLGPPPARRAYRHEAMVSGELAIAMRDYDVDDIDVQLFNIYAAEAPLPGAVGAGGYKRLYLPNFVNMVRDLLWLRDGPDMPSGVDAFRLARFLGWRTVTEVQQRYPGIEPDGEAAKP